MGNATTANSLIEIRGLKTYFHTDDGVVKAVDDISFKIDEGKTLGLVGESGSGKSVTSLTVLRLLPELSAKIEAGTIAFVGKDLVKLPESDMRKIRGKEISMIFQEPMTSLNPVFTVGDQVAEAIHLHQSVSKREALERTIELFKEVGIPEPERRIKSYPHEMSGGQKQRVMIAMALSCNPKLLIADEPTTALDVTIQAQILDLMRKLRDQRGMSILFITHDLGVIAEIADDVAVMYRGKIVEIGSVLSIFQNSKHPYTKGLLACRPRLETTFKRLPTVSDFMETGIDEQGEVEVISKELSEEKLQKLALQGRGRLLHSRPELLKLGYSQEQITSFTGVDFVAENQEPLLKVEHLKVHFPIKKGILSRTVDHVRAVDDISFHVYKGQTLGLVGESGCGKTTTGRAILKLIEPTAGNVLFKGLNLTELKGEELRRIRQNIQIIFQDPYSSLNPRMTVEAALTEPMKVHGLGQSRLERRDRAARLLEEVGLQADHLKRYPHEFSGGQRQRICIARALSLEPEFIICDESVSALDVSVQAQVLNLLKNLQEERGLTYIFISHDLSVVKFMSDMMAVMHQGRFLEYGPSEYIYQAPQKDYTKQLIDAVPKDSLEHIQKRQADREAAFQKRQKSSS